MPTSLKKISPKLELAQIAWVVKDIKTSEKFFRDTLGIENIHKIDSMRSQDSKATYYGKPADFTTAVCHTYSGGTFVEIIQPLSGQSIFQDYLDKNPSGGVQHVAYRLPVAELDAVIAKFASQGFEVVSSFYTEIATIVFFDTYKELGVMTEIMGITDKGWEMLEQMKGG